MVDEQVPGDVICATLPNANPADVAMRSRIASRLFGVSHAPSRISRFEVQRVLGSGGMGVVYAAIDPKLERMVALKLLSSDRHLDERHREQLAREARSLAKLSHPNVVTVHEVGEHDGSIFIVMEHVDGVPLQQWMRDQTPSLSEVLHVYIQAAEGLSAAHDAGIVHRDFKPSNVLIGKDGRVRVADFGLAKLGIVPPDRAPGESASGNSQGDLTRSTVLGTPAYMSPEQTVGEIADAKSDQFSLCVALWEAVFGVRPWEPAQLREMAQASGGVIPSPTTRRGGPRWLRRTLARGMSARADARWPSVSALQSALKFGMRRPRRIRLALGAVSIAGMSILSVRALEARCEDPAAALGATWNDERRTALERHVRSTAPFATSAVPALESRIEGYASTWTRARVDTCEATYERREQSDEQFDRSVTCLERARRALASTVDVLVGGSPETIARADRLLNELPAIGDCRDPRLLRDGPTPPPAAIAAEIADVHESIDRASALVVAGEVEEALSLATSGYERALGLGDPATAAEAECAIGQALAAKGDIAGARKRLFAAASGALAARANHVAVDAWHRLVLLAAVDLEAPEEAREWLTLAQSAMALTGESALREAEHLNYEGTVLSAKGDLEAAVELHRRAASMVKDVIGADDMRPVEMERLAGNALFRLGRLEEARDIYSDLEARVVARLGSRHPEYARINHNLALIAEAGGSVTEARRRFNAALSIITAALGPRSLRAAPTLTGLARLLLGEGETDEALRLAALAWDIQRDQLPLGHSERGSPLALLGAANMRLGNLEDALRQFKEVAVVYAAGPHKAELPKIYQNISWLLCELDRCLEARPMNETARRIVSPDSNTRLYVDAVTARIELADGRVEAAIARAESLIEEADEMPYEQELGAEVRWTLAKALAKRGSQEDLSRAVGLADDVVKRFSDAGLRADALPKLARQRQQWSDGPSASDRAR